jgi:hypothetical protein
MQPGVATPNTWFAFPFCTARKAQQSEVSVGAGTKESSPATRELGLPTESLAIGCCERLDPSTGSCNACFWATSCAAAAASCAATALRNRSSLAAR